MSVSTKPFLLLLNVVGSIALGLGISYYAHDSSTSEKLSAKKASTPVARIAEKTTIHSPLAAKDSTPETQPTPTNAPSPTPGTLRNNTDITPTPTPNGPSEKTQLPNPTPTPSQAQQNTARITPTSEPTEDTPKKDEDREPKRSTAGEIHNAADSAVKDATRGKVSLSANVSL